MWHACMVCSGGREKDTFGNNSSIFLHQSFILGCLSHGRAADPGKLCRKVSDTAGWNLSSCAGSKLRLIRTLLCANNLRRFEKILCNRNSDGKCCRRSGILYVASKCTLYLSMHVCVEGVRDISQGATYISGVHQTCHMCMLKSIKADFLPLLLLLLFFFRLPYIYAVLRLSFVAQLRLSAERCVYLTSRRANPATKHVNAATGSWHKANSLIKTTTSTCIPC